jgi:predicted lipoprotein with Yx(FWY)xxD motif
VQYAATNLQLAAGPAGPDLPPTPADVSLFVEGGKAVFRSNEGFSLYTYDKDPPNKTTCVGACSQIWLPLLANAERHPIPRWTLVDRPDGTKQWAYKGKPLYTFKQDEPGKPSGDGVDGVWHLVKP